MTLKIAKHDAIFKKLRWACLAVARKDGARPALECLHVKKLGKSIQFTGCDGFRLHRFSSNIYPQLIKGKGLFSITKITKSEIILDKSDCKTPYPNVEAIIPDDKLLSKSVKVTYADGGASLYAVFSAVTRLLTPTMALNADMFKELLDGDLLGEDITLKIFAESAFIILQAPNMLGLLTPIKIGHKDLIIEPPLSEEEETDGSELLDWEDKS